MMCPKCKSQNVSVSAISKVKEKRKRGCLYWAIIGWWWEPLIWICFGIFKLIYEIFRKKTTVTSKVVSVATCQNCGHRWQF